MDDEEIDIKYLLKQVAEKQEEHIKASNQFRLETTTALNDIKVHGEYARGFREKDRKDIDTLMEAHNQQKWILRTLSALGLFGIEEFVRHYFIK